MLRNLSSPIRILCAYLTHFSHLPPDHGLFPFRLCYAMLRNRCYVMLCYGTHTLCPAIFCYTFLISWSLMVVKKLGPMINLNLFSKFNSKQKLLIVIITHSPFKYTSVSHIPTSSSSSRSSHLCLHLFTIPLFPWPLFASVSCCSFLGQSPRQPGSRLAASLLSHLICSVHSHGTWKMDRWIGR